MLGLLRYALPIIFIGFTLLLLHLARRERE